MGTSKTETTADGSKIINKHCPVVSGCGKCVGARGRRGWRHPRDEQDGWSNGGGAEETGARLTFTSHVVQETALYSGSL